MAKQSKSDTIAAWLETIVADSQGNQQRPGTVLPRADSKQPLLASFQSFSGTSSAAPIDVGATIAEGGMGVIKVAEQLALGRTVVVKTLRSDYAAQAAEHVLREAWATGALEHPNIVPVHDIRTDEDGSPMIILKRIEGDTWTTLMHNPELIRERFGAVDALDWNTDILRQVTQAVRFSHSRGILHRDLKPDNVMIGAFGEVYLVDWGIAMSLRDSEFSRLPAARDADEMAGTPCYMAPEMLGEASLDERTDVYLLGAILFEILAGRPPHSINSLSELLADIRQSEPRFPEDACPILSELCRRAMRADPNDRHVDASEFAAALAESRLHRESAAMADVAHEQLQELETRLGEGGASRHEVYGLFGALRLGFKEALKIWPDNESARSDMDRASVALIRYELGERNPRAAHTLYEDLIEPGPALAKEIDDALRTKALEESELEKFRVENDPNLGQRTRIFLILIFGTLWTGSPLYRYTYRGSENMMTYDEMIVGTLVFLAISVGFMYWARESLSRTLVNRQLSRNILVVFPSQVLLLLGSKLLDLPLEYSAPLMLFLWLSVTATSAANIDFRFWPAVVGYATAFLVACHSIELRYFAIAAGNLVMMSTCVYIWYPKPGTYETGIFSSRKKQEQADPE